MIDPYTSGEDSDEDFNMLSKQGPTVSDVVEALFDSRSYQIISEEEISNYMKHNLIVYLMFPNINSDFNSFKFQKFVNNILWKM